MSGTDRHFFAELLFLLSFVLAIPMLVFFVLTRTVQLHDILARSPWSSDGAGAPALDAVRRVATEYLFGYGELPRAIFSAREIAHMHDVRLLFVLQSLLLGVGVVILIGTALYLRSRSVSFITMARRAAAWGLIATVALGFAMIMFFDQLFIWFHQVLFTNDYWLLDPATDIIIRAYPPDFFQRFAVILLGAIVAIYASVWTMLTVFRKR